MLGLKNILFSILLLVVFKTYSQDEELKIYPKYNQSLDEQRQDENQCSTYADYQSQKGKYETLKNTEIGAGVGVIGGGILGKPIAGATIGGAAEIYRSHKKSMKERDVFDQTYASCLRDQGYDLNIQPKKKNGTLNKNENKIRNNYKQYDQGRNINEQNQLNE